MFHNEVFTMQKLHTNVMDQIVQSIVALNVCRILARREPNEKYL